MSPSLPDPETDESLRRHRYIPSRARVTALVVSMALSMLGLASCGGHTTSNGQSGTVKIAVTEGTHSPYFNATLIAFKKGYFKDEGVDAQMVSTGGGTESITSLISGDVQLALSSFTEVAEADAKGQHISFVGDTEKNVFEDLMMGNTPWREHNLSNSMPWQEKFKALDGANFGVSSTTSGTSAWLRSLAKQVGISIHLVTISESSAQLTALKHGSIDAMASLPADTHIAIDQGFAHFVTTVSTSKEFGNSLPNGISATNDWISSHPKQLAACLRAIQRGMDLINKHNDEAARVAETMFPNIPKDVVKAVLHESAEVTPTCLRVNPSIIRKGIALLVKEGSLDKPLPANRVIDNSQAPCGT